MWFWANTYMPLFMDSRGERDAKIVNYRILCIYVENQIYRAAVRANRSITHHLRHAAALSNITHLIPKRKLGRLKMRGFIRWAISDKAVKSSVASSGRASDCLRVHHLIIPAISGSIPGATSVIGGISMLALW